MTDQTIILLAQLLEPRLSDAALDFWQKSQREIAAGAEHSRFSALISMASRHAKRVPLTLSEPELAACKNAAPDWAPQHWNLLELLRVALICARNDLTEPSFTESFESLFVYADEGETCALYRALALLPAAERFVWRAGEGCRSNMVSVFSAMALDNPYPVKHFDATGWNQLVIKALFLELPLHRVIGLDERRSAELTRIALDLADERASAGRVISHDLWLCLESSHAERSRALAECLWPTADASSRSAIVLGLARAEQYTAVQQLAETESDIQVAHAIDAALGGQLNQTQFAHLVTDNSESEL
ncbi:EboA domain-containing protein [Gilvimarinus polysaccharolyticus]|uniref:EboA domain-containing protein n=1 Tax=Gilvimarinus polysaccharolyticus TaxID=863921 RepID=UPI000673AFAD|nr:EboA domain-containing protein [Gilvimarinus polysaccharolyticus]